MHRMITYSLVCLLTMLASARTSRAQSPGADAAGTAEQTWVRLERRLEAGDYVKLKARDCGSVPPLKSLRYDTPTVLRFKNTTGREVKYYWINYEGRREQERTLKAGETQNVRTYVTHPFMVVDASGGCSAVYMPRAAPGLVVIGDTGK